MTVGTSPLHPWDITQCLVHYLLSILEMFNLTSGFFFFHKELRHINYFYLNLI